MSDQIQPIRVYWTPHCSSCQRVKEFLRSVGIAFESVNVRDDENAVRALQALGARGAPIVTRGDDFIYAQSIQDVARFVGVTLSESIELSASDLLDRAQQVVLAAVHLVMITPAESLNLSLPKCDRSYRELAHHIFHVVEVFLEAADGAELSYDAIVEELPAPYKHADPEQLAVFGRRISARLSRQIAQANWPPTIKTFYGEKSFSEVLERTVWHGGHHARQLRDMLIDRGLPAGSAFPETLLQGLPAPEDVLDREAASVNEGRRI